VAGLTVSDAAEHIASAGVCALCVGGPLHFPPIAGEDAGIETGAAFRRSRLKRARSAEAELVRRGIPVRLTPSVEGAAPAWMRAAANLGRRMAGSGFVEGTADHEPERRILETNPLACFTVLLGRLPFSRDSLEGRLQRQLALIRERVFLPDPMDALVEITAHHLLAGHLQLEGIARPDALDALVAALTALRMWKSPAEVVWLGNETDGRICLPIRELGENYRVRAGERPIPP
jgi:hypothetical protein